MTITVWAAYAYWLQAAVEDDLVHVDIALPDFKIAFFLEGAEKVGGGGGAGNGRGAGAGAGGSGGGGGGGGLSALDAEGVMLSG